MELGEKIASGRSADIHAWNRGQVVKLFLPACAQVAETEATAARLAAAARLPVPAFFGRIERDGRVGLVFARVDSPSLDIRMQRRPWQARQCMRSFARLHAQIHSVCAPDLASLHERLAERICLAVVDEGLKNAALRLLAHLPEGDRLCHGDFHPGNVLLTPAGPIAIDWPNAARGVPDADVAQSILLFRHAAPLTVPIGRTFLRLGRSFAARSYVSAYLAAGTVDRDACDRWLPVLAVARLAEGIASERQKLISLAQRALRRDAPVVRRGDR